MLCPKQTPKSPSLSPNPPVIISSYPIYQKKNVTSSKTTFVSPRTVVQVPELLEYADLRSKVHAPYNILRFPCIHYFILPPSNYSYVYTPNPDTNKTKTKTKTKTNNTIADITHP